MPHIKVKASEVQEGDFLPGLDNGYVIQDPETGDGYLSYPSTGYGMSAAMPADTVVITFHDSQGEENYLLCNPDMEVTVSRGDMH